MDVLEKMVIGALVIAGFAVLMYGAFHLVTSFKILAGVIAFALLSYGVGELFTYR